MFAGSTVRRVLVRDEIRNILTMTQIGPDAREKVVLTQEKAEEVRPCTVVLCLLTRCPCNTTGLLQRGRVLYSLYSCLDWVLKAH